MYKIEEVRNQFGKAYNVEVGDYKRQVNFIRFIKEVEGFIYMVLLDTYGNTVRDAYRYLNDHLEREAYQKRELSLSALKCLYSFMAVFNVESPKMLDKTYRNRLIGFLQGGEFKGVDIEYHLQTQRNNNTINNYFSVYRAYFKFLELDNEIFSDSSTVFIQKGGDNEDGFFAHTKKTEIKKYDISLKRNKPKEVPKYISFEEYKKIMDVINIKFGLREKVFCRLMYEYGLRIGEVLGLTLEDVIYDEELYNTGNCSIILRNRFTDKPYQFAKGCEKVPSRTVYDRESYYEEGIGYQTIRISSEMALLIQDYINETKSPFMSDVALNNLNNLNKADKVSDRNDIKDNKYVFLGKNYTPITSKGWNDTVKEIFKLVGIKVDKEKKKENLNHRFRHGFAMFKVYVENYDLLRLAKALRHSNINSAIIYFNPTEEDRKRFAHLSINLLEKGGVKLD
jgi:integrase